MSAREYIQLLNEVFSTLTYQFEPISKLCYQYVGCPFQVVVFGTFHQSGKQTEDGMDLIAVNVDYPKPVTHISDWVHIRYVTDDEIREAKRFIQLTPIESPARWIDASRRPCGNQPKEVYDCKERISDHAEHLSSASFTNGMVMYTPRIPQKFNILDGTEFAYFSSYLKVYVTDIRENEPKLVDHGNLRECQTIPHDLFRAIVRCNHSSVEQLQGAFCMFEFKGSEKYKFEMEFKIPLPDPTLLSECLRSIFLYNRRPLKDTIMSDSDLFNCDDKQFYQHLQTTRLVSKKEIRHIQPCKFEWRRGHWIYCSIEYVLQPACHKLIANAVEPFVHGNCPCRRSTESTCVILDGHEYLTKCCSFSISIRHFCIVDWD